MEHIAFAEQLIDGGDDAVQGVGRYSSTVHHFSPTNAQDMPCLVCTADGAAAAFVLARLADYLYKLQADSSDSVTGAIAVVTGNCSSISLPAHQQLKQMRKHARYCLSVSANNPDMESLPQVNLGAANDDERASACLFGLSAVIEREHAADGSDLGDDWYGEQFVIQMGQAGQLKLTESDTVFQSLLAFLSRTGLIALGEIDAEDDLHYFGPDQLLQLHSEHEGLFVCSHSPGTWVAKGENIGVIYDQSNGERLIELAATASGLITALRRTPFVVVGDLLAEIGEG